MGNFTFLKDEEEVGNKQLSILRKYGTKCSITDFSILLGGYVSSYNYTIDGVKNENRTGWWWCDVADSSGHSIGNNGYLNCYANYFDRIGGARPAINYSSIFFNSTPVKNNLCDVLEVLYGEYPQMVATKEESILLDKAFKSQELAITGKKYTTDSTMIKNYDDTFQKRVFHEYEYMGNKYIRFIADENGYGKVLSDGRVVETNKAYWIKVERVEWLVDEKSDIALAKKILFSGVQFKNINDYNNNFIFDFMNQYFQEEIKCNNNLLVGKSKEFHKKNPYHLDFSKVTEEDIIKGAIISNISVFIHGKSGEGKTTRVKHLDPDCEILYMRNATPDSLNGKSVYNSTTGEMIDIPPSWYKKVIEKCEREPEKIHIIFFDELTNALPSIQGMAFNIILDKEVNGKWVLPKNARIVASGNEVVDSYAANYLVEPLFNRFAHVYIKTDVNDWLKWANTNKKDFEKLDYNKNNYNDFIHPAIYAYIAYKAGCGYNILRSPYNGETPNVEPRKWEMASSMLYQTKKPEMLRSLIGEEITKDFISFVKKEVITINDVIEFNYDERDLEMDLAEKYALAVGLSSVSEEHIKEIRDFIKKVGEEVLSFFDSIWIQDNVARKELIDRIKKEENHNKVYIRRL